ncbi:hypothetical protein PSACC_01501 [Paramicrosporidium saccamoebae]|uniref:Uncharacterized protein n=1 Tax=Paramicrosporidium saccamoebae TaxID=1246581 RepID=A0A2H9TLP9_9FUNG|nr:hypothetical protein PSACC_01501 [Paramicrosporidium saccamoebae]
MTSNRHSHHPAYAAIATRLMKSSQCSTMHYLSLVNLVSKQFVGKYTFPANWKKRLLAALRRLEAQGQVKSTGRSGLSFQLHKETIVKRRMTRMGHLSNLETMHHEESAAWTIPEVQDYDLNEKLQMASSILLRSHLANDADKFNLASLLVRRILHEQNRRAGTNGMMHRAESDELAVLKDIEETMSIHDECAATILEDEDTMRTMISPERSEKVARLETMLESKSDTISRLEYARQKLEQELQNQDFSRRLLDRELETLNLHGSGALDDLGGDYGMMKLENVHTRESQYQSDIKTIMMDEKMSALDTDETAIQVQEEIKALEVVVEKYDRIFDAAMAKVVECKQIVAEIVP